MRISAFRVICSNLSSLPIFVMLNSLQLWAAHVGKLLQGVPAAGNVHTAVKVVLLGSSRLISEVGPQLVTANAQSVGELLLGLVVPLAFAGFRSLQLLR